MNIQVNPNAPVRSRQEVLIAAPVDTVWKVLTGISQWTTWQKNMTKATLQGELAEGAPFHWKAGGISFSSRIHTMKPKTEFGWTGTTLGASAIHNWTFRETDHGTLVTVEESLQGVLPRLLKKSFQKSLDTGMQESLVELKSAAEHPRD